MLLLQVEIDLRKRSIPHLPQWNVEFLLTIEVFYTLELLKLSRCLQILLTEISARVSI